MMLIPRFTNQFKKDRKLSEKRGQDISKLDQIMELLINEIPLPPKNKNHKLVGDWKGFWECHIEPDWLLIYEKNETHITFTRIASHSDLKF